MELNTIREYLAQFGFTEKDFETDESKLDVELLKQPSLLHVLSDKCSEAKQNWERCKSELKSETAKLSLSIRKKDVDIGIDKLTEGLISDYLECAEELLKFKEAEFTTRYEYEQWSNASESVKSKGFTLKVLSDLYQANYWTV